MKIVLILLLLGVAISVVLELSLRYLYGFGNPLLYVADVQTGYRIAPNQSVRRSGNRIQINQYSMRGSEISPTRPAHTLRILLLGDSIANGGWWTDQADILSEQIAQELRSQLSTLTINGETPQSVEVLNASANSWGPRNELAYLAKFGHFESQAIVLLINTDDLFTIAPTSLQVGRDRNYPARKPPLAIVEVIQRYALKPDPIPELQELQQEGGDRVAANMEAMRQIKAIAQQNNSFLLIAMTPLLREVGEPGPRDYELEARRRLQDFMRYENIPYIDYLPMFNQAESAEALYRDNIHLSSTGNQIVRDRITEALLNQFNSLSALPGTAEFTSSAIGTEPFSTSNRDRTTDSIIDDPWATP